MGVLHNKNAANAKVQCKRATALVHITQLTKSPHTYERPANLYIVEKYFQCTTINDSVADNVGGLAIVVFQKCKVAPNSENIRTYSSSRSSYIYDDFGTNRKRLCDFLLVINSILRRF